MDWLAYSKAGGAGPRSLRRGLRKLEAQIEEHEAKIARTSDPDLIRYWRREIEGLRKSLERQREKVRHD